MDPIPPRKLALAWLGVSFHSLISKEAKKGFQGSREKRDVARSTFGSVFSSRPFFSYSYSTVFS
jgi:hypothetical protein